jgi:hypothetical protein
MAMAEAEALAHIIFKKPRTYLALTLGRLIRLTREEHIALPIRTIRPFDKTDAEMKEDRLRRDKDWQFANRAANKSGRPRGRPKSTTPKPHEAAGMSKTTYYRRLSEMRSNNGTKNASAV